MKSDKIIFTFLIPLIATCFVINCSMNNELREAVENLQKEADKCIASFDKTIAIANQTTHNLEKLIETLQAHQARNYSQSYNDSNTTKK